MKKRNAKQLIALLAGFCLYLMVGGFIFQATEDGRNTGESKMTEIFHQFRAKDNLTRKEFDRIVTEIQLVYKLTHYESKWTFYSSMYFCGSVVTTIGRLPFEASLFSKSKYSIIVYAFLYFHT